MREILIAFVVSFSASAAWSAVESVLRGVSSNLRTKRENDVPAKDRRSQPNERD